MALVYSSLVVSVIEKKTLLCFCCLLLYILCKYTILYKYFQMITKPNQNLFKCKATTNFLNNPFFTAIICLLFYYIHQFKNTYFAYILRFYIKFHSTNGLKCSLLLYPIISICTPTISYMYIENVVPSGPSQWIHNKNSILNSLWGNSVLKKCFLYNQLISIVLSLQTIEHTSYFNIIIII